MIGKTIAQYEILSRIGQGGMGEVYAAKDTRLDRTVALKTLPPQMASVPERRARFEREAKAVAALNHPNIVTLHSVEESDGLHFLTMELVEGRSLGEIVPDHGLAVDKLFELAIPIVDAVAAAHRKGIAHRDLKPDNVMVTEEGWVKVLDFGLAKLLDPTDAEHPTPDEETSAGTGSYGDPMTEEGRVLGTVAYMSPEQAEGKPSDHRSDIFSLGVLLYAMSTGRRPFQGDSNAAIVAAILRDTPKPVHEVNTDLPRELGRVVRRCLEKDPNRRFQGAEDLRLELEDIRREFVSGELSVDHRSGVSIAPSSSSSSSISSELAGSSLAPESPSVLSGDTSSDSFVGRWHRAGLPRLLVVFVLLSVLVLLLVRGVMLQFGLPGWVLPAAFVLLLIGLPILVGTAWIQAGRDPGSAMRSGDALDRSQSQQDSRDRSPLGLRGWLTWKKAMVGGALAFVAWALVVGGYVVTRSQGIGPAASLMSAGVLEHKSRVLIADFLNQTDDPLLGLAMKEAFTVDLSQSSIVRIVSQAEVASALGRMEMEPNTALDGERAREIAIRDGIPVVIAGQINPAGSGALLSVRLIDAESGTSLAAFRENAAGPDEMIPAIDRLSSRMREKMGESLKTIRANPPLDQVTTRSLSALQKYTEAVEANDVRGDQDRAIALLEEATAADTTFAMAFRKLSVILSNSFRPRSKIMDASERAFRHRDRLTERERYLTEANYYNARGDRDKAKFAYRQLLEMDPEDGWALNNLGTIYLQENDPTAAEEYFLRLERNPLYYGNLVSSRIRQGKIDLAEETLNEYAREYPDRPLDWFRMALEVERENYAGAQEFARHRLEETRDSPSDHRGSLVTAIALAYTRGQVQEARRLAEERIELIEKSFTPAENLGATIRNAVIESLVFGEDDFADDLVQNALRKYPIDDLSPADRPYLWLSFYYEIRGMSDDAKAAAAAYDGIVSDLERQQPDNMYFLCQGVEQMKSGNTDAAVREFQRWDKQNGGLPGPHAWLGNAYYAEGQLDSAIVHYEAYLGTPHEFKIFHHRLNLARVLSALADSYEQVGNPLRAAECYIKLADLWADADPKYLRQAEQARKTAERLLGDGG